MFSSVSLDPFSSFEMYSMRLPTFWRESSSSCFTNTGPNNLYTLLSGPSKFSSSSTHLFSFSWLSRSARCLTTLRQAASGRVHEIFIPFTIWFVQFTAYIFAGLGRTQPLFAFFCTVLRCFCPFCLFPVYNY